MVTSLYLLQFGILGSTKLKKKCLGDMESMCQIKFYIYLQLTWFKIPKWAIFAPESARSIFHILHITFNIRMTYTFFALPHVQNESR